MEIAAAQSSATVIANQIPSISKKMGRINTQEVWNTSVRKKDMAAEIAPLLSAVKKEEAKMLKPARIKEKEKSRNAWLVNADRPAS